MVKSGLEEPEKAYSTPRVSPYRLTAHLLSAFTIYGLLFTTAMKTWPAQAGSLLARAANAHPSFRKYAMAATHMAALTAISGAFVAGNQVWNMFCFLFALLFFWFFFRYSVSSPLLFSLFLPILRLCRFSLVLFIYLFFRLTHSICFTQAGFIYNEFPLMGGRWVPEDIIEEGLEPKWKNAFENSTMVQFNHRYLGISTLALVMAMFAKSRGATLPPNARIAANAMMAVAGTQVALGITTLLMLVPVPLGVAHQAGALTLLSTGMWLLHAVGPKTRYRAVQAAAKTIKGMK